MKPEYKSRTGLQRFMDKFPYWQTRRQTKKENEFEYLGVGAMMVPVERLSDKGIDQEIENE